eukprot:3855804-Pleurochrysis_carterae.AAC.2
MNANTGSQQKGCVLCEQWSRKELLSVQAPVGMRAQSQARTHTGPGRCVYVAIREESYDKFAAVGSES